MAPKVTVFNGVVYSERPQPTPGTTDIVKLESWHPLSGTGVCKSPNGLPSPFYFLNRTDYAIRLSGSEYYLLDGHDSSALMKFLDNLPPSQWPVDQGMDVEVTHGLHGLIFKLALVAAQSASVPPPYVVTNTAPGIYTWTATYQYAAVDNLTEAAPDDFISFRMALCECGAFKTYGAKNGSSLHSSWCPAAKYSSTKQ